MPAPCIRETYEVSLKVCAVWAAVEPFFGVSTEGSTPGQQTRDINVPRLFMSANLARLFVPAIVPLFACRRWLASPGLAAGARIE